MARTPRPLSLSQLRMLQRICDGVPIDQGIYGMSGYAGVETTKWSLVRRGLVEWTDDYDLVITAAGRAELRKGPHAPKKSP